jgi:eukaryotic-like serine/threonine-protein kinase
MSNPEQIERYELLGELATGGMGTVYLGRQRGPFGFSRTVAIKSLHPQFAKDEGFRAMFLDEATLTARIRHPNVIPTLDIVSTSTKLLLVMEYVDGVSLASLLRAAQASDKSIAPAIAAAIVCDALHGLHAAHELKDDSGQPLSVIHRDVSPQNVHVGMDGLARILDFGVAKATTQRYVTQTNEVKGKLAYMSPEQVCGERLDRRADIYAAGVVLWEALTRRRLFSGANDGEIIKRILDGNVSPPSFVSEQPLPDALDRIVMKALAYESGARWETAEEMAGALASAVPPASRGAVTGLVKELAADELASRAERLRQSAPAALESDAKLVVGLLTERATRAMAPGATEPAPRTVRRATTLVVALSGIALTAGAFFIGSRTSRAIVDTRPSTSQAETAASSPGASMPPSPDTAASVGALAPPSAKASTEVSAAAPSGARPRPAGHKPAASAGRSRTGVDCRVPYTVNAKGDRHYKEECVE